RSPALVTMAASTSPVACGVWGGTSTSSAAGCEPAGEEHVPAAASAEESAAAESLSELLPESCSGSEAPHPAGSTRARTARAADSMRAGDFGRWIRAWERLCAGWPTPSSYSRPTTGRVRILSRPKSIRTRPPLERCLDETTVERRGHCACTGVSAPNRRLGRDL